jgi:DNA-binding response OmpR family regulator
METFRILVVEDDKEIREGIAYCLKSQGFEVSGAADGIEGLEQVEANTASCDRGCHDAPYGRHPYGDEIAEKYDFPVLMLSAKTEEVDKILGLNMGADDYIEKPFRTLELLARVNAHLKRYSRYLNMAADNWAENSPFLTVGGLEMNSETMEVWTDGSPVKLTPIEFRILQLMMQHPGKVYTADDIYTSLWNDNPVGSDTIMVHIRNIRKKIESDPKAPKYLKVGWGIGYKIEKQT